MAHPLFDLTDRVAIVSGAASGLGKAIAMGLAEVGADIVLADIDAEGAQRTGEEIEALGRRALPVVCDMSDPDVIRSMYQQVDREWGRLDVLANIAGASKRDAPLKVTEADLEFTLRNLVVGRLVSCQEAGKRMLEAGRGSIINLVSIAGLTALGRSHLVYSIAMGGAAQMTRELSTEWAAKGVRVNAIVCAQIMNDELRVRISADAVLGETYLRGIPIGRLGEPEEIKGLAIFLASDASSFVTGAMIPLDGGNLAKNAGGSHPGMPGAPAEQT